jgi:hypothetical protein
MSCIKYEFETITGGLALAVECNRRENHLAAAAANFLKIGCINWYYTKTPWPESASKLY